ncbi:hypothetical protein GQ55_3G433000 [Panicum hallii var. hallii]|uniref:Protein kinase domain-containing protein n=1 Tax=Panicum hallii var. hallii TaxID=1504633 RepID=A0A2T7EHW4_9POAL|nr:hypothetical protein GQ55_3G433000 [Panicum hallii var. hallii]
MPHKRKENTTNMDAESNSSRRNKLKGILQDQSPEPHNLSLKDLKEITNDFSDERLLGQGGFGKVYKGVLRNGDMIAVKKLTWTLTGIQDKQYENEARHLMRLRHPNIVQLVGYCSETEKELVQHNGKYVYAEKPERLLCLEYLPKGSLRMHLSDASSGLDWDTRYKIIKGICYGLHYLHEEWQAGTPIIHRDLKPANILLDDNMVPKIADFGLARLFGELQTRTITKNHWGTLGYMSPEYLNRGIITKELDIFSLGVIIIEITTGEKHYPDNVETSSQEFIELVLTNWKNKLEKVHGYTSREFDCQQIRKCIEIGLLCVKLDRAERPTTRQIIEMLAWGGAECSNKREIIKVTKKVSEEVEKAMFRQFSAPAAPPRLLVDWNQRPRYHLVFLNGLKPLYTTTRLEADDGTAIKVAIVERLENNRTNIVRFGPLSSVRVEVVALHGKFNAKSEECWSPEEFNKHIVTGRQKRAYLLTGNLTLKLNGGEALLENAIFTDKSSFTSAKTFRLGLRLVKPFGERVLEGVTKPFRVKERRVEGFGKHYPPMLDDEVWRLKKIGKTGAYHQALSYYGIDSVKKFLQAYMKDDRKLVKIFYKMPQSTWNSIIEHAMTCKFGDSLYLYEVKDSDAGLYFDEIYQLVGVKFGDCYKPIHQLDQIEKNLVDSLKQVAYQNIDGIQSNYKMVNNYPVLHLLSNGENSSNHWNQRYNGETIMQSQQVVTGFQPSRTNSFDSSFCDDLIQKFISQIPSSDRGGMPLSPSENSSNHWNQRYNGETIIQSQQVVTGFQTSRTNCFDSSSCEDLNTELHLSNP